MKRGRDIFDGEEPHTLESFVGQQVAVHQLMTAINAALRRGARLDHVLLASGVQGIGKTTLAKVIAYEIDAGLVSVSGSLTAGDVEQLLRQMDDRDVLFWDEVHLAVQGGRTKADFMLPLLSDGVLLTPRGRVEVPDVTVVAATTDVGRLPLTLTSRFMLRPTLEYYSTSEAALIGLDMAERVGVEVSDKLMLDVALAANCNPREMRAILTGLRDVVVAKGADHATDEDLDIVLRWLGLTRDGLSRNAQDMLLLLLHSHNFTASMETVRQALHEPGPLRHIEQQLVQKGYVVITGRGRALTEAGIDRASQLAEQETE